MLALRDSLRIRLEFRPFTSRKEVACLRPICGPCAPLRRKHPALTHILQVQRGQQQVARAGIEPEQQFSGTAAKVCPDRTASNPSDVIFSKVICRLCKSTWTPSPTASSLVRFAAL